MDKPFIKRLQIKGLFENLYEIYHLKIVLIFLWVKMA